MKDLVISQSCTKSTEKFWKALYIWIKNPHLINRRILTSIQLGIFKLKNINYETIFTWLINLKKDLETIEYSEKYIVDSLRNLNGENVFTDICYTLEDLDHSQSKKDTIYVRFAKLLPRHIDKFAQTLEISLINVHYNCVTYFSHKFCNDEKKLLGFQYPYQIKYENNCISILVQNLDQWKNSENFDWLINCFFCKFLKWVENDEQKSSLVNGSLNLISTEEYTNLYNELKKKYGIEMVKVWPENTDPEKFVYEDVAIATYLILLWKLEREKLNIKEKQSFLDLGCGNGLLVHILNSEGFPGFGMDLRKRKIWDIYPETTKLKVQTIIPSSKCLFPETDWLIGNHSDELTPWIPVIAARSSYRCRFFLLPCCAYEFNGKKYQRENSASSQYSDYLAYIKKVSRRCGFKTDIDKLRIPSTKRICLIGTERSYSISDSESHDLKIQEMINIRCNDSDNNGAWTNTFTPRHAVEKVRNCTQIEKSLIHSIISIVSSLILDKTNMVNCNGDKNSVEIWNAGGEVELFEVAIAIGPEKLKKLKKECGGLQTLLKNNGHIFKVEYGKVRFRIPGKEKIGQKKKSRVFNVIRREKECWFHKNHPNGCPQTDNECDFKH